MLSMSRESTTERFCSSLAMARSKAFCLTILLHSWYFSLASLSFGLTFTTCGAQGIRGRGQGHAPPPQTPPKVPEDFSACRRTRAPRHPTALMVREGNKGGP